MTLTPYIVTTQDGSVEGCLAFLQLLAKSLQCSLPVYRASMQAHVLLPGEESGVSIGEHQEEIVWGQIPLGKLTPCQLGPKPQYYELKVRASLLKRSRNSRAYMFANMSV